MARVGWHGFLRANGWPRRGASAPAAATTEPRPPLFHRSADGRDAATGTLHIWDRLRTNWVNWVDRRNVLTHVRPGEDAGSTFAENAAQVRTWHQIELTVLGITQFMCQEVSLELLESVLRACVTTLGSTCSTT